MLPMKDNKNLSFKLPCEWRKFQQVLVNQEIKRSQEDEYCYRVAWANLIVDMPQIFLPFMMNGKNKTIYEQLQSNQFLLGDGK